MRLRIALAAVVVITAGLPRPSFCRDDELTVLQDADASKTTYPAHSPQVAPRYRLAAGVSYTGAQIRYLLSSRWAVEGRYQFGKAESNYGDVKSDVFGLRAYRFIPYRPRLSWYLGAEAAGAKAKADNTLYETSGFTMGGFGGLEYRPTARVAISADIGPYMISLKEKHTGLSDTNLDFVLNTALNFYIF